MRLMWRTIRDSFVIVVAVISCTWVLSQVEIVRLAYAQALLFIGTPNEVLVTRSGDTVVFSTPQDIAKTSSPTFAGMTLTNGLLAQQFIATTSGVPLTIPGDLVIGKTGFLAVAPGPGAFTLRVRQGSVPGTCKLVVLAGTSNVEFTPPGFDNIGSGC